MTINRDTGNTPEQDERLAAFRRDPPKWDGGGYKAWTTATRGAAMTADEAFAANLKRTHECLVEAKACLYAAARQQPNRARTEVYDHFGAAIAEQVSNIATVRYELGQL